MVSFYSRLLMIVQPLFVISELTGVRRLSWVSLCVALLKSMSYFLSASSISSMHAEGSLVHCWSGVICTSPQLAHSYYFH